MMDDLAQQLRDERSLRLAAERRAAELAANVGTWRSRAEERAERIEQLEHEREAPWVRRAVSTARRALRAGDEVAPPGDEPTDAPTGTAGLHVAFPSTRALAITASAAVGRLAGQFLELAPDDPRAWHEADLVIVEDAAWDALDADLRTRVAAWLDSPGRAPVVRFADAGRADPLPTAPDLVVPAGGGDRPQLAAPTFDPRVHIPWGDGAVHVVERIDWDHPDADALAAAAAGRLALRDVPEEQGRAVALRLARRHHAPWVRAGQLVASLGVDAAPAPQDVGALLVSRRPELVAGALQNLLRSRHVDLEVVVALHGVRAPAELHQVVEAATVPCRVIELSSELSLGACLNQAAAATGAAHLAKIDDDDHYGPGHLEDAVQSLQHTGAGLVGKAEQFTYVEAVDRTVRRRVGTSETFVDGTPSGASWVFRRRVWEQAPFPHRRRRVDDLCLGAMRRIGVDVYVNGPWEFCVTRAEDGHTWVADDDTFLAGAEPAWDGRHDERVELDESVAS